MLSSGSWRNRPTHRDRGGASLSPSPLVESGRKGPANEGDSGQPQANHKPFGAGGVRSQQTGAVKVQAKQIDMSSGSALEKRQRRQRWSSD
jgi:hypothetical protein